MENWQGALMSAHAGKMKASLGLSDSVYDRNRWSQFLTLSKSFHDNLDINPGVSWVQMTPGEKDTIRRKLAYLCHKEGLFHGYEETIEGYEKRLEPALEWRMYHLQKTKSQKHKAGSSGGSQSLSSPQGLAPVMPPTNINGNVSRPVGTSQPVTDEKAGKMPYDPIRDKDNPKQQVEI